MYEACQSRAGRGGGSQDQDTPQPTHATHADIGAALRLQVLDQMESAAVWHTMGCELQELSCDALATTDASIQKDETASSWDPGLGDKSHWQRIQEEDMQRFDARHAGCFFIHCIDISEEASVLEFNDGHVQAQLSSSPLAMCISAKCVAQEAEEEQHRGAKSESDRSCSASVGGLSPACSYSLSLSRMDDDTWNMFDTIGGSPVALDT